MITIKDVAKKAGVSITTVSRVINGSPKVSKKTKEKVVKAMKELGFSPRPWAKYLALPRVKFSAGVVITERIKRFMKEGAFYHSVFEGVSEVASTSGVEVKVLMDGEEEKSFDGYLLFGADFGPNDVKRFMNMGKPIVLVDNYIPGLNVDVVISDGYGGAFNAVQTLINYGYRKIVHIHSPLSTYSFRDRFNGYVDAMEKNHLMPKLYEFDDIAENMSYVIDLMLNSYGVPEAIFTSNDFAAKRAIKELRKRRIKVPEDVAIMGFDDSEDAKEMNFSSVRVFKKEMGSFSMRRLITLMMGQDVHPAKISLFTELIIRGSIKKLRGRGEIL
ncbi:MAG: LacI family DNA-binding transcriptional regulator [Thermotogaceae bacterium]|nr:LacI family DNA-binding transcriptional regulator [Thermotogaceae bacterium]